MDARQQQSTAPASKPFVLAVPDALPRLWSGRIRRSKLQLPAVPATVVSRPRVLARIDRGGYPLTLIVAPAGYGKTMAAAEWARLHPPSAWLTVDDGDVALPRFWAHIWTALRNVAPGMGDLVNASLALPHGSTAVDLGRMLADELLDATAPLRLVIDDLHAIPGGEVYDFLTGLFEYPPERLRLVVTSRGEPPLPLMRLRIHDAINELRGDDLLFSEEETRSFVAANARDRAGDADRWARGLWRQTGGWAAGIRLAAAAEPGQIARTHQRAAGREFDTRLLAALLEETLAERTAEEQRILLRAALPERFSGPLVAALTGAGEVTTAIARTIEFARTADLCRPSPQNGGSWLEFHALFRAALLSRLEVVEGPAALNALHRTAAEWFATAGAIRASIGHWLSAGEHEAAAALVERELHRALAQEDWPGIARWYELLPDDLLLTRPQLMLGRAWLAHLRGRYGLKKELARAVERRLDQGDLDPSSLETLRAELDTLKLDNAAAVQRNPGQAIVVARRALDHLPDDRRFPIGIATMMTGLALHSQGQRREAEITLHDLFEQVSDRVDAGSIRGLFGLCYVHLQEGELFNVETHARVLLDFATRHQLRLTAGWGNALIADALYERNDLAGAILHDSAVAADHAFCHFYCLLEAHFALAQAYLASGQDVDARRTWPRTRELLIEANAVEQLPTLDAYSAYLALLMGETARAVSWAQTHWPAAGESSLLAMYSPFAIRATILAAAGGEANLQEAAGMLAELRTFAEQGHFTRPLVRIDCLAAIIHLKQGDRAAAQDAMRRSLDVGLPRGFVRAYLDLATLFPAETRDLLARADLPPAFRSVFDEHRRAVPAGRTPDERQNPISSLTSRELQVLAALDRRLSYEEIADLLFISPHTVKRHACNVYAKLEVSGRAAALQAARGMGWQPDRSLNI